MSLPLVSIIIPTFNRHQLLQTAIDTVLQQTYRNIEVIIVDDASSDATAALFAQYNDSRIKYIRHSTNKGGAAARNTGVLAARGEYVTFLDDDDSYHPTKVQEQVKDMEHYDVAVCGYRSIAGRRLRTSRKSVVELNDLRYGSLLGGGTSLLMLKRNIIREYLFDERLPCNQDWDLVVRLAKHFTIGYNSAPLVFYNNSHHSRISNQSRNLPLDQLESRLLAARKHKDVLGEFWFNYRMAQTLLAFVRYRKNIPGWLRYTVTQCGIFPVLLCFCRKLFLRTSRFI